MIYRTGLYLAASLVAVGVIAGLALAQLSDSQTAAGTVNVTSTSADLYICEPGTIPGPACGPDDSGADETVFETLEDIRPGETVLWDIRLTNVGSDDWTLSNAAPAVTEIADPGNDCPDSALKLGRNPADYDSNAGAFILGKNGDSINDNPLPGASFFLRRWNASETRAVRVVAGDYEDVRLSIELITTGTEDCDGNEWSLTYTFEVS